jgi:hypothetical protein
VSFADEFPNDNPDLFMQRPLTALHLAAIYLAPFDKVAVEAVAVEAVAVEAVAVEVVAVEAADEPAIEAADCVVEEMLESEALDIEVVEAFDESDFEHATLESLLPPSEAFIEVEPEPIAEAARAEVFVGPDGDSILDPPSAPDAELQPLSGTDAPALPSAEPDYASLWADTLRDVALSHGAALDAVAALSTQLATDPVALAWRIAIMGGEADFSACGTQTLDEWSAHLVARAAGSPAKFETIRRELRSRGICAFGLVVEAA